MLEYINLFPDECSQNQKRSLLSNEALDDLLTLTSAKVLLKDFCLDDVIDLWKL